MTSKVEESSHIINVRVFTFLHMLAKLIILRCYKFLDESQIVCKTPPFCVQHTNVENHTNDTVSTRYRLIFDWGVWFLDFRIFELCCELFWAVNVLTSLELFVEKNCMRSHKTTLPGGKHRKSENRVEMAEY